MALTHSHYLRYRRGGSVYTKYGNTTKQTTPSIAFRAGGKTYYIPLSQATPNASYPIGVRYNNNTYRIGTASATFTATLAVSVTKQILLVNGFSVNNGGFDQSWTVSAKLYLSNKNEYQLSSNTPKTYSASTTSASSTVSLGMGYSNVAYKYAKIFIKVFNVTYSTDYIDISSIVAGTSVSITVT